MAIDLDQFKGIFFEESFEGLDAMESGLLEMNDGGTNLDTVNTIFRAAHSIKGGSGTFGLDSITSFTHIMEGMLDEMREGKREATPDIVNVLLESVDVLRELMTAYQNNENPDVSHMEDLQKQLAVLRDSKPNTQVDSIAESDNGNDSDGNQTDDGGKIEGWNISFHPHADLFKTGNDPSLILRELSELGEISVVVDDSHVPAFSEMDPEVCYLSWEIHLKGEISEAQISEVFEWVEDDCDLELNAIYPPRKEGDRRVGDRRKPVADDRRQGNRRQEARRPNDKPPSKPAATIRVGTDRIDGIIDMVGELVITQSMLSQLGEDFDMSKLGRLRDGLDELERNSRELQENIMRIRMQPISFAFNRFPRVVHDLSQKLGKKIRLEMVGEETEMDKTVMEKINDPLVHLVRNCLDHGLETPEERLESCKDEEGYVRLKAFHQGGSIVVEVSDDGRGLSREKILNKALEKGLVKESDVLTDEQVFMLLFKAGFSTAEKLSDISGRGVGLDVVRRNIESLGGNVEVRSTLGEGSTFTIRLPLTLAVLDGQLFRVGGDTYVLPLAAIVESLQIKQEALGGVAGDSEVYRLRDEYIPIVRLSDVFSTGEHLENLENALLVVVEWGEKHIGLLVDELLGQQQVVIKSLETNYKRVRGISGATILGDGTVSLILDISGLIEISYSIRDALKPRLAVENGRRVA